MPDRPRYHFKGSFISRGISYYRWEGRVLNDSRVDQVSCPAGWFWGGELEPVVKPEPLVDYWWVDNFVSGPEADSIKGWVAAEVESAEVRGWARAMRALEDGNTRELDMAAHHLEGVQSEWLGKRLV